MNICKSSLTKLRIVFKKKERLDLVIYLPVRRIHNIHVVTCYTCQSIVWKQQYYITRSGLLTDVPYTTGL